MPRSGMPLRPIPSSLVHVLIMGMSLAGCGPLADPGSAVAPQSSSANRSEGSGSVDAGDTRLAKAILPWLQGAPTASAVVPLVDGMDAFAARTMLIDAAERTIDAQYYIWQEDLSGVLLLEALQRAADRGVRVRLLLDDNRTFGMDRRLAALDAHENIEVRLFNPFRFRFWRVFDYLFDFRRINHRMHNKSFTVDNQVTVLGGRNIGDEYFDAAPEGIMYDLDVLAIGAVVQQVSADFERYWNSRSAYPAHGLLPEVAPETVAAFRAAGRERAKQPDAAAYQQALRGRPPMQSVLAERLSWVATQYLSDDPAKALGDRSAKTLWHDIEPMLGRARREMGLISPYVVPHEDGAEFLLRAARAGTKVSVLTNSLEATDVAAVHAGYAKWRRRLLEGGVQLFEMKRDLSRPAYSGAGPLGSSASTLHAKLFAVDGDRVFIGSFNFDPRSARLNTENGLIIESPALAGRVSEAFITDIPQRSYKVELDEQGRLRWIEQRDGQTLVHREEPGVSAWRALSVKILSHLPIDWLL